MNCETHLKEKVSKDAQVMTAIIRNIGIEEWEPKVIQQMLEYSYKWVEKSNVSVVIWLYLQVRDRAGVWRQDIVAARA